MIKPRNLIELAESLVADDRDEAEHRAAVSRAYYAAFHTLRRQLESRISVPKAGAHGFLDKIANANLDRQKGNQYSLLLNKREDADYELSQSFRRDIAEEWVRKGRELVELIPSVPWKDLPR